MLKNKVLYYNAHGETKADSLIRVLNKMIFPDTGIVVEQVDENSFIKKVDDSVALLIIPGARAGQAYRDEFGRVRENREDLHSKQFAGRNFHHMKEAIERGLCVMGICAGGFVLCNSFQYTEYDPNTGEPTNVKNVTSELGLIDAHAYGPDLRLYQVRPREAQNPWTVYCAANVTFQTLDGNPNSAYLAVSKGPSFINCDPLTCETIATYAETNEAAIIKRDYGLGKIILCGPVPEVGGPNLIHYVHQDYRHDARVQDIITKLESSQQSWAELWWRMLGEVFPHAERPQLVKHIGSNLRIPHMRHQLV